MEYQFIPPSLPGGTSSVQVENQIPLGETVSCSEMLRYLYGHNAKKERDTMRVVLQRPDNCACSPLCTCPTIRELTYLADAREPSDSDSFSLVPQHCWGLKICLIFSLRCGALEESNTIVYLILKEIKRTFCMF